ncbi:MAG: hypothetical protein NZ602_06220 [Thermoguttaceae bacterium]|nr:hypothetical protein [Thermoguttaceae bacterium]
MNRWLYGSGGWTGLLGLVVGVGSFGWSLAAEPVEFSSPGFPPSRMDSEGRLVEDWGLVAVRLQGQGLTEGSVKVEAVQLDGCIPAAQATADRGPVRMILTAYRSPIFPAGVDVLTVRLEEKAHQPIHVTLALDLPPQVKVDLTTARIENRIVLSVPLETLALQAVRDWGYCNETTAMPGWAKPEGPADPAFANIRAGMGGIPILYRFKVEPNAQALVVLGLCESHYDRRGIRPILCEVEGARPQWVDPIAQWGRHKPGALLFHARDLDADGQIEIAVRPVPGAPDRNPILNVIWVFPPGKPPDLKKLIAGQLSSSAKYYIDVGGQNDQCFYQVGKLQYPIRLSADEVKELTFWVACPGASAPVPETTTWTPASLRQAARQVCQAWQKK